MEVDNLNEEILESVLAFAKDAHATQMRKYTPEPYIVHPIRVMETCKKVTSDVTILAAALLHDVIEDTAVTPAEMLVFLKKNMSETQASRTLELVIDLTDVYVKEAFPNWNRKQRKVQEVARIATTSADSQND